jgi:hypothetical protein
MIANFEENQATICVSKDNPETTKLMPTHKYLRIGLAGLTTTLLTAKASEMEAEKTYSIQAATQLLIMERNFGQGVRGSSGTASLNLDFEWRPLERTQVEGEFVQVTRLYEEGREDAAYTLSNDNLTTLNALSVSHDFSSTHDQSSVLKVGRLRETYDFFPTYKNARHKVQAFEGIVWQSKWGDGISLDIGHLERYSSWSSREGGPSPVNGDFITLSERLGGGGSDSGVQYFSTSFQAGRTTVKIHDYYADDWYNNAGLKVSQNLSPADAETQWSLNLRYDRQDGVSGGRVPQHEAEVFEATIGYRRGGFSWNAGWTHVGSEADYLAPFRTSHEIDMSMLWFTNQYEKNTDSFHWKGLLRKDGWVFYSLLIAAEHENRKETEANFVIRRSFDNRIWVALFGAYGQRDFDDANRGDQWARDLRFYMGYTF